MCLTGFPSVPGVETRTWLAVHLSAGLSAALASTFAHLDYD